MPWLVAYCTGAGRKLRPRTATNELKEAAARAKNAPSSLLGVAALRERRIIARYPNVAAGFAAKLCA